MKKTLILILIFIVSCNSNDSIKDCDLQKVVKDEMLIGEDVIISRIINEVQNKSVLVLGERHYITEHSKFVSKLIDSLYNYDFRILLIESLPHSASWIVEDFLDGKSTSLPFIFNAFDSCYIHKICKINQKVTIPSEKITLGYIDLNHDPNTFLYILGEMPMNIKNNILFSRIKLYEIDSEKYKEELLNIYNSLKTDSLKYISTWSKIWFDRLKYVLWDEIESSHYRMSSGNVKDSIRESIMLANINSETAKHPNEKIIINVGGWHAQKKLFYRPFDSYTLTSYLSSKNHQKLYSIKFTGFKGEYISSNSIKLFNTKDTADEKDLSKTMLTIARGRLSFLPLSNTIFKTGLRFTDVDLKFDSIPLGLAYDALIAYPEMSFNPALNEVLGIIDE